MYDMVARLFIILFMLGYLLLFLSMIARGLKPRLRRALKSSIDGYKRRRSSRTKVPAIAASRQGSVAEGKPWVHSERSGGAQHRLRAMLLLVLVALGQPLLANGADSAEPNSAESSIQGAVAVVGPNGESTALESVTVTIRGDALGQESRSVVTDAQGRFKFDQLSAGTYELEVRVEGFQPFVKSIPLGSSELRVVDVALEIERVVQKLEVHDQGSKVATKSAAPPAQLNDREFQELPLAEQKFKAAMPLVPGVVRTPNGKLNMKGASENQGMLLVDSAQTVDPVTGSFSIPVPIDSVHTLNVYKTPYDAEYGGFSGGLTTIETKPPTGQWKYGVMDFIPGLRGKAGHIVGISDDTPRVFIGGPVIKNKLNFSEAATYDYVNRAVRGLAWPHNETKQQGFDSLTSIQAVLSSKHLLSVNVNGFSNRVRYADINSLVPQPASSDDGQRGISLGATDTYQFGSGALLSTLFQYTRFDSNAHGQGPSDMLITPEGWGGNFFDSWTRSSNEFELMPVYRLPRKTWLGRHDLSLGTDFTHRSYDGNDYSHQIQLLRQDGSLAERIAFEGKGRLHARDKEVAEFIQDHWGLNDRLALDLGGRLVTQSIGRSAAFAPRAGLVYSPGSDRRTIIRVGAGLFYGVVPLLSADFADYPTRVVTLFDGSGLPLGPPVPFLNAYVQAVHSLSSARLVNNLNTSARNFSTNLEVDRELTSRAMLRLSYLYSQTQDLYIVTPLARGPGLPTVLGLADTGGSDYHEIETTLRYKVAENGELNISYVYSRGRGDLNTVSDVFVPFSEPVVRPNMFGSLDSDVPNRLVTWGLFPLPWKLTASPVVDVHTGFPYSEIDPLQNYVGTPNGERFPTFFSLDLKVYREFKFSALPLMGRFKNQKLRFGVYSINLTNHLNYLDVYNNVASPYFGHFAGFQHRVNGLVIDLVD